MPTLEEQAIAYGSNSKRVEDRLRKAARLLLTDYRKGLDTKQARYDAQTRMLISADDRYALAWQLRNRPDQPIGYLNQQTSVGVVNLLVIGGFEINPNGG
jgi:ElaB/YqjD/DUF883 family membrane-anchored ribosome-binding protein